MSRTVVGARNAICMAAAGLLVIAGGIYAQRGQNEPQTPVPQRGTVAPAQNSSGQIVEYAKLWRKKISKIKRLVPRTTEKDGVIRVFKDNKLNKDGSISLRDDILTNVTVMYYDADILLRETQANSRFIAGVPKPPSIDSISTDGLGLLARGEFGIQVNYERSPQYNIKVAQQSIASWVEIIRNAPEQLRIREENRARLVILSEPSGAKVSFGVLRRGRFYHGTGVLIRNADGTLKRSKLDGVTPFVENTASLLGYMILHGSAPRYGKSNPPDVDVFNQGGHGHRSFFRFDKKGYFTQYVSNNYKGGIDTLSVTLKEFTAPKLVITSQPSGADVRISLYDIDINSDGYDEVRGKKTPFTWDMPDYLTPDTSVGIRITVVAEGYHREVKTFPYKGESESLSFTLKKMTPQELRKQAQQREAYERGWRELGERQKQREREDRPAKSVCVGNGGRWDEFGRRCCYKVVNAIGHYEEKCGGSNR